MRAFAAIGPIGIYHGTFDIENGAAIESMLTRYQPDLVVNTAAFHNVELCEVRPDRAIAVNAIAVDQLANRCIATGTAFAHVSTDYVFDGSTGSPYAETAPANPLNVYGISKYAGELLILRRMTQSYIFRTTGLYGTKHKRTFVERVLERAHAEQPISVVTDLVCSPSYTRHVAEAIHSVIQREAYGIYHVTNSGACSWFDFACELLRQAGSAVPVRRITSEASGSTVRRPKYTALANDGMRRLNLPQMPTWQQGITAYLMERSQLPFCDES